MNEDPFDDPFFNDGEDGTDPFDEVRSAQRRGVIGFASGAVIGVLAGAGAFLYAEPQVGVWALLIALVVFVVVGYMSAAVLAALLAFGGGSA